MNNKLKHAQDEWNNTILNGFIDSFDSKALSRPFYMGVSEEYKKSSNRIMIIGQEAKDFGKFCEDWPEDDIREWTIRYLRRQLWNVESNNFNFNRSAFWKLFRYFSNNEIIPCWNNIDKLHRVLDGTTVPLSREMEKMLDRTYGNDNQSLLQREINICKPDCLLLIVGPRYTYSIEKSFGLETDSLNQYKPTLKNCVIDISDQIGTPMKAIWTYHPTYLNRMHLFDECVEKIYKIINKI